MTALLQVEGLGKRFGGFVALDGIQLEVKEGEIISLVGANGAGKTTLVRTISGFLKPKRGSIPPLIPKSMSPVPRRSRASAPCAPLCWRMRRRSSFILDLYSLNG